MHTLDLGWQSERGFCANEGSFLNSFLREIERGLKMQTFEKVFQSSFFKNNIIIACMLRVQSIGKWHDWYRSPKSSPCFMSAIMLVMGNRWQYLPTTIKRKRCSCSAVIKTKRWINMHVWRVRTSEVCSMHHMFELSCSVHLICTFIMISYHFYLPSDYVRRQSHNSLLWLGSCFRFDWQTRWAYTHF